MQDMKGILNRMKYTLNANKNVHWELFAFKFLR